MTLVEIMQDIHACEADMLMYERKYNILSETFYESYMQGDEPPDDAWVLDWGDWPAPMRFGWIAKCDSKKQSPRYVKRVHSLQVWRLNNPAE